VRGVDDIDQEIHNHAGNRNIEPQRQRPPRNPPVQLELLRIRSPNSDEDQRHNEDRKEGMRRQKREIYRPNPPLALKVDHLMDAEVVNHIGNKKSARNKERR